MTSTSITRRLSFVALMGLRTELLARNLVVIGALTVKNPDGGEHEVLIKIDEEAVGYVERMTRRRLPGKGSFWTIQAQRLLSDYLWKEGKVPPARKLTVKDVDRDELPIAARW